MWSRCCCSELGAVGLARARGLCSSAPACPCCVPPWAYTGGAFTLCAAVCPALQRLAVPPLTLTPPLCCSVVFPMLCFDDEDAELWADDPQEYIRKVRASQFGGCVHGW